MVVGVTRIPPITAMRAVFRIEEAKVVPDSEEEVGDYREVGATGRNGHRPIKINALQGERATGRTYEDEMCIHGYPGGKGCYLCNPDHPYRQRNPSSREESRG